MTRKGLAVNLPYKTEYVELQELRTNAPEAAPPLLSSEAPVRPYRRYLFLALVGLPTLLAAIYFFLWASPVYESETKFVLRQAGGRASLPQISDATGMGHGNTDVAVVNTYLTSPDALRELQRNIDFPAAYGGKSADVFSRFPGILWRNTDESRLDYYQRMVAVEFDKSSDITTLSVRAFSPDDAVKISRVLLAAGEALSNRLSERMRRDMIALAEDEVKQAEAALAEVQAQIAAWRQKYQIIDPVRYSEGVVNVIAKMSLDLSLLKAQRQSLLKNTPDSPQLGNVDIKIKSMETQIQAEWAKLAGGDAALANDIAGYERLLVESAVAEKVYALAKATVVTTRAEAQQHDTYLVAISEPQRPSYARYPRSLLNVLLTALMGYLVFVILSRLIDNILRHGDVARYTMFSLGESES